MTLKRGDDDDTLLLTQGGRNLHLQKAHIKCLQENDEEIYVNAEMALEDREIAYELELTRQIVLSVSDISQLLTIRRYYMNNLGDKTTLGKKILAMQLRDVSNFLGLVKKIGN